MSNAQQTEANKPGATRNQQIVVFKIGHEEYGLLIDQIKEVVITPNITQMPQTPSWVKGVANIRGNVIAILDLEEKFKLQGQKSNDITKSNYSLVIESEEYKMGIMVREVPNTLTVSIDTIESTVFIGDTQGQPSYITGVVKLEKRLIIMIDIFKVIADTDANGMIRTQLEAFAS